MFSRSCFCIRAFILGLVLLVAPIGSARAAVSDEVLDAVRGRVVVLIRTDAARHTGRLLRFTERSLVLEDGEGRILLVPRAEVDQVRTVRQSAPGPEADDAGREERRTALTRADREDRRRSATHLLRAGAHLTVSGLSLIVLGGVLHGVAQYRECDAYSGCTLRGGQMATAALAFYIVGPILAAAGIPMWAVGATRRGSRELSVRDDVLDPRHEQALADRLAFGLPRSTTVAAWSLRY